MNCPYCHTENEQSASFCRNCGRNLKVEVQSRKCCKLTIKRKFLFYACAMPIKILINDKEVGRVKVGGTITIDVPTNMFKLKADMVGNIWNLPSLRTEIWVDPNKSKTGNIYCEMSLDASAIWTLSLRKAPYDIILNIHYN